MLGVDTRPGAIEMPGRCPGFVSNLILRCARGDRSAMGSLFDLMYPLVADASVQRFPALPTDDVVAAVFVQVWRYAPAYTADDRSRPIEWILGLVSTVADRATSEARGPLNARPLEVPAAG